MPFDGIVCGLTRRCRHDDVTQRTHGCQLVLLLRHGAAVFVVRKTFCAERFCAAITDCWQEVQLSALGTMPACCRHLRVSACAAQGGEPPLAGIPHQPRARPRPAIGEKSDRVAGILSHVDSDFSEFIRRRCRHCPRKLDNQRFREKAIVVDLDFVPLTPCDCYSRVHVIDFAGTERHS